MFWLEILALIVLLALFIALLVGIAITLLFIFPMARGAVYVPSKDLAIATMIKFAKTKTKKKSDLRVVDLGSGDGRVVKAFALQGIFADGFEVNPWLVWKARHYLRQAGVSDKATIYAKSYWNIDLSDYNVVTVYGITYIMEALEKKLRSELKPGSLVLSNYFTFPHWKPHQSLNGIHVYKV